MARKRGTSLMEVPLLQSQPRCGRNLFEVKSDFLQTCISQDSFDYFNLVYLIVFEFEPNDDFSVILIPW